MVHLPAQQGMQNDDLSPQAAQPFSVFTASGKSAAASSLTVKNTFYECSPSGGGCADADLRRVVSAPTSSEREGQPQPLRPVAADLGIDADDGAVGGADEGMFWPSTPEGNFLPHHMALSSGGGGPPPPPPPNMGSALLGMASWHTDMAQTTAPLGSWQSGDVQLSSGTSSWQSSCDFNVRGTQPPAAVAAAVASGSSSSYTAVREPLSLPCVGGVSQPPSGLPTALLSTAPPPSSSASLRSPTVVGGPNAAGAPMAHMVSFGSSSNSTAPTPRVAHTPSMQQSTAPVVALATYIGESGSECLSPHTPGVHSMPSSSSGAVAAAAVPEREAAKGAAAASGPKAAAIALLQETLQAPQNTTRFKCPSGVKVLQWSYIQRADGRLMFRAVVGFLRNGVPHHIAGEWYTCKKHARQSAAEVALGVVRSEITEELRHSQALVDVAGLLPAPRSESVRAPATAQHVQMLEEIAGEKFDATADGRGAPQWQVRSEGPEEAGSEAAYFASVTLPMMDMPYTFHGPLSETPDAAKAELARRVLWYLGFGRCRGFYVPNRAELMSSGCQVPESPRYWSESLGFNVGS
mmetsp:Transcript_72535/g.172973  ORF Transcript_72535/g.172973 Transcript_72535/m.172973 type:complete len:578 (+) Transcript_72535:61-1794(+)